MSERSALTRARARSRFAAIVAYTFRSCLPPKRWFAVAFPCAGALLFGLLARAIDDTPGRAFANVAAEAIFGLLMPIAALIIGDSVLGAEVRAGTFHFTWLSPAPVWQIVVGRWLGGAVAVIVSIAPACALSAVVAGVPENAWPAYVAGAAGGVAYIALFIAIACITKRTAVWSLAIVFLIERLLGSALSGIAQLSPTWESRAVYVGLAEDVPRRLERAGVPTGSDAVLRLAIIAIVGLLIANWRMPRMHLASASD
jgi:ABC-type transport system involved in multi-copper enzyme maturation permease subunit